MHTQQKIASALILACSFALCRPAAAADAPKAPLKPAAKEQTVADLLNIAKNSKDSEARTDAIRRLADVTASDERANDVAAELLNLVIKENEAKGGDPFVRIEAIRALGNIQKNANPKAKDKYIGPFRDLLKDNKTISKVRKAVLVVFRDTLDRDGLPDKEAFKVVMDLANDKTEQNVELRGEAAEVVGAFASVAEGVNCLVGLMNEPDPLLKEHAARGFFTLFDSQPEAVGSMPVPAVNKLVEMLTSKDIEIELRVYVLKVLAQLIAQGNKSADKAFGDIVKIVKEATDDRLVLGGIEALGIVGSAEAVEPLTQAYSDYLGDKTKPANEKDVHVRQAIMKALRSVLSVQNQKQQVDAKALKATIALLVKAVDDDPSDEVKLSAVYSLGYLYPAKFAAELQDPTEALIFLLRATKNEELKKLIPDRLEVITNRDYGQDWKRWYDDYYKPKYKAGARAVPQ